MKLYGIVRRKSPKLGTQSYLTGFMKSLPFQNHGAKMRKIVKKVPFLRVAKTAPF